MKCKCWLNYSFIFLVIIIYNIFSKVLIINVSVEKVVQERARLTCSFKGANEFWEINNDIYQILFFVPKDN